MAVCPAVGHMHPLGARSIALYAPGLRRHNLVPAGVSWLWWGEAACTLCTRGRRLLVEALVQMGGCSARDEDDYVHGGG